MPKSFSYLTFFQSLQKSYAINLYDKVFYILILDIQKFDFMRKIKVVTYKLRNKSCLKRNYQIKNSGNI